MKVKIDFNSEDIMNMNDPVKMPEVLAQAHTLVERIFEDKDKLMKCTITVDGDKE